MKLSVLGPAGTFTDMAARRYLTTRHDGTTTLVYQSTFAKVAGAVAEDTLGLLPLENQLDGYVQPTLALLQQQALTVIGEVIVPINFGLVARAQTLEAIKRIFVQFKTQGQCQHLLAQLPQATIETTTSNMLSLEAVQAGQPGDAAIVPMPQLAELEYPLMQADVADQHDNATRFVVLQSGRLQPTDLLDRLPNGPFKLPLYITPHRDDPGTLYDILGYFAKAGLNLITLMSQPTKERLGVYSFYLEISGESHTRARIRPTLAQLSSHYQVDILGLYPTIRPT